MSSETFGNPPIPLRLAEKRIANFMTRNPIYATPATTVGRAISMMLTHEISALPVVDDSHTCMGMYSELDAMIQAGSQPLENKIRYKKPAVTVMSDASFKEVLMLLAQKRIRRVPVTDERRKLVGIIARRDLLRAFHEVVDGRRKA